MAKKKEIRELSIPTIIDKTEIETMNEIQAGMNRYRAFARSVLGENHEIGTIKIRKGQPNPEAITMLMVEKEFVLAQRGRNNTEETIKTYRRHFTRLYRFLGYHYIKQSREIREEVIQNIDEYGNIESIGASMPVLVLSVSGFSAHYTDYLRNVRHLSEQTIVSSLRNLRAITYFCQEQKWIREFNVKIKEVQPDIKPTFTKYELEQLSRRPRKEDFIEYRTYVMIRYLEGTGNRVSSMLALNVNDINFEDGTITVNVQKNRKPKLMPLIYELRKVLKEYIYHYRCDKETELPLGNEPLFCNKYGERLSYESARDAFKDYFERRGCTWEGFHKFRHTYASNWIRDGGNPFMLKEQLGHTSLAMTNRYANIYGMATKEEAEQHSLSKKYPAKTGRKAITMRK